MNFNVEGDRTVFVCDREFKEHYLKDFGDLERDLQREGLSNETKTIIKRGIETTAARILKTTLPSNFFAVEGMVCYRSPEEGIDIYPKDTDLEGYGGSKFSPEINLQVAKDKEKISLQLAFEGLMYPPFTHLLQMHNALEGGYDLSLTTRRNMPMFVVNPIQQGLKFVEVIKRIYDRLHEYSKKDFYSHIPYREEMSDEVKEVSKGVYAKELLNFLGVKL